MKHWHKPLTALDKSSLHSEAKTQNCVYQEVESENRTLRTRIWTNTAPQLRGQFHNMSLLSLFCPSSDIYLRSLIEGQNFNYMASHSGFAHGNTILNLQCSGHCWHIVIQNIQQYAMNMHLKCTNLCRYMQGIYMQECGKCTLCAEVIECINYAQNMQERCNYTRKYASNM